MPIALQLPELADLSFMQYLVLPDWLHEVHLAMPSEHAAHSFVGPQLALVPGFVMQWLPSQTEHPAVCFVCPHVPQPVIVTPTAGHVRSPDTQQLVPSHVVHWTSVALHSEHVVPIALQLPELADLSFMQYLVLPDWLHEVHLAMPSEHAAHSFVGPQLALVPGFVMQWLPSQTEHPAVCFVCPHVPQPVIVTPTARACQIPRHPAVGALARRALDVRRAALGARRADRLAVARARRLVVHAVLGTARLVA